MDTKIRTATAANAAHLAEQLRIEITTATVAYPETLQQFRTDIDAANTANTQMISAIALNLKGTRDLLSVDQIESQRWIQDAVTKIEVSLTYGNPAGLGASTAAVVLAD